jgi:GH25 family lysozyme M1 (1,4-beta-N-acetylmuramidase)
MAEIRAFEPITGVASAQGLDVSNFQGNFNWSAAVRAYPGLHFGIYRLTQGLGQSGTNSPDPESKWNHQQIRDNGLKHGAYHFLDPFVSGAAQARYFVDMHAQLGFTKDDMLWCDNETAGTSPGATSQCCSDFMAELVKLRPDNPHGVYTFISFAKEGYCSGAGKYPLWLAYPNATAPQAPPPWVNWTFWQWGTRNGVDADAFNGTTAQMDAWLASFQPPAPGTSWSPYTTDGTMSLQQIGTKYSSAVSSILRRTAQQFGPYDATTAAYVNGVFGGTVLDTDVIPAGAKLMVKQ